MSIRLVKVVIPPARQISEEKKRRTYDHSLRKAIEELDKLCRLENCGHRLVELMTSGASDNAETTELQGDVTARLGFNTPSQSTPDQVPDTQLEYTSFDTRSRTQEPLFDHTTAQRLRQELEDRRRRDVMDLSILEPEEDRAIQLGRHHD